MCKLNNLKTISKLTIQLFDNIRVLRNYSKCQWTTQTSRFFLIDKQSFCCVWSLATTSNLSLALDFCYLIFIYFEELILSKASKTKYIMSYNDSHTK